MNNKAHLRPKDYDSNGDIIPPLGMANFCPNCGADMRGDKDGR